MELQNEWPLAPIEEPEHVSTHLDSLLTGPGYSPLVHCTSSTLANFVDAESYGPMPTLQNVKPPHS